MTGERDEPDFEYRTDDERDRDEFERAVVRIVETANAALRETAAEADAAIGNLLAIANARVVVWRGQASAAWSIALVLAFILGGVLLQPR